MPRGKLRSVCSIPYVFTLSLALKPQETVLALCTGWVWLAMLLTSPQHSSFIEDLLKVQGFPELVRQCQNFVLSHHFQQLSLAIELVFNKSVSHCQHRYFESSAFYRCAHNCDKYEKTFCRSSSMGSSTVLLQTNLVFPS